MKKLISILIIFATTTIPCMTTAMTSFDENSKEMDHNMMQEKMTMSSDDCSEAIQWDCEDTAHECCISPFSDSGTSSNINNSKKKKELIKWKILDFSFLVILQEDLEYNYIEKLNSSPVREDVSWLANFYITLTGTIKSNC